MKGIGNSLRSLMLIEPRPYAATPISITFLWIERGRLDYIQSISSPPVGVNAASFPQGHICYNLTIGFRTALSCFLQMELKQGVR